MVRRMKLLPRTIFATGVAAALLCGLPPPAGAQQYEPKLDRELQNAHGGSRQRVIVRFRTGAGGSVEQKVLSKGNKVFSKHSSIDGFTAELRADQLAEIARDPNVESIGVDADVFADAVLPAGDVDVGEPPAQHARRGRRFQGRWHRRRGHRFGNRPAIRLLRAHHGVLRRDQRRAGSDDAERRVRPRDARGRPHRRE